MYKVKALGPSKPVQGKYGELVIYQIQFEGREDWIELSQKPTTPAPTVGQELEGDIENTQYGPRFKKAQKAFNGGSSGMSNKQVALLAAASAVKLPNDGQIIELADKLLDYLAGSPGTSGTLTSASATNEGKSPAPPATDLPPVDNYEL